ncbi:hypothetical protein Tco_1007886, partial [Tanacetum coccineum]
AVGLKEVLFEQGLYMAMHETTKEHMLLKYKESLYCSETNIKTVSVVRENVRTTGYDQHRTKKKIGSRMIQEMYGNPPREALHPSRWALDKTRAKVKQSNPRSPSPSRSSHQNRDRDGKGSRLFKAWQLNNHSKNSSISSKPDRAHICTISGAILASPRIRRRGERTVGFEGAQSRGKSRVERNTEGGRPLEEAPRGNRGQSVNLPPLLAAHLGRGENGQPLQSSLTSAYGGQALPNNIGGNLLSNGTFLSHHAQPFMPASLSIPNGFMPTHIHPYQQPTSFVNGQHLSFLTRTPPGNLPMGGIPAHLLREGHATTRT